MTTDTTASSRAPADSARNALRSNLVFLRAQRRLSQTALAERAGVTRYVISEAENGKPNITIDVLDRLAIALETTVAELFRPIDSGDDDAAIARRLEAPESDFVNVRALLRAVDDGVTAGPAHNARFSNRGRRPTRV